MKQKNSILERSAFYEEMVNLKVRPLLSVCISTYNRANWLSVGLKNLERILPEINSDVEIIVCDNASTDNSAEVVKPYLTRDDFYYYCNTVNVGMLGNLRVTANHAKGKYIWILGDDDLIKLGCIERVLEILRGNPDLALLYMNYAYHREDDISNVTDLDTFMSDATAVSQPSDDINGKIKDISTQSENFFTAIYCLVFRRDHAIKAYSQNTDGRPFSSMLTCIPTTYYVLNYMMDEPGYWLGSPQIVINLNVSWMKYATLWILERLPEAHDLAEKMGANKSKLDELRHLHMLQNIPHWFREIYKSDPIGNMQYFNPARLISRINHLARYGDVNQEMSDCYSSYYSSTSQTKIPPKRLFSVADVDEVGSQE